MSNVRGKTTCLEAVYDLITAYTGNSFATYCKGVLVGRLDIFSQIPDAETPCVVLDDGGEDFKDAGVIGDGTSQTFAKVRQHNIKIYVVEKYLAEKALMIGDAEKVGIIDFSHLVELAFLSSKKLASLYKFKGCTPWQAVNVSSPDNPNLVVAVARECTLTYETVPEAV